MRSRTPPILQVVNLKSKSFLRQNKPSCLVSLTNLQTDMGKTIVRRHLANTDALSVWKEFSEHMRTSSKGTSAKRRLTQYVTNTVLDDNFKGTTEQFVLHFNEQFRQLVEISEDNEKLPPTVKLTLLQTAVRSINDLKIVETLDEFQSTTYGHGSSTPWPMIPTMIYLSMPVLGMTKLKRPI